MQFHLKLCFISLIVVLGDSELRSQEIIPPRPSAIRDLGKNASVGEMKTFAGGTIVCAIFNDIPTAWSSRTLNVIGTTQFRDCSHVCPAENGIYLISPSQNSLWNPIDGGRQTCVWNVHSERINHFDLTTIEDLPNSPASIGCISGLVLHLAQEGRTITSKLPGVEKPIDLCIVNSVPVVVRDGGEIQMFLPTESIWAPVAVDGIGSKSWGQTPLVRSSELDNGRNLIIFNPESSTIYVVEMSSPPRMRLNHVVHANIEDKVVDIDTHNTLIAISTKKKIELLNICENNIQEEGFFDFSDQLDLATVIEDICLLDDAGSLAAKLSDSSVCIWNSLSLYAE